MTKKDWVTACLGLGSNLGDREKNITDALDMLGLHPQVRVSKVSSLHETEPVGYEDQPRFINAAAVLRTTLDARGLLELCRDIEKRLGRVRGVRWGPRSIDLDILLFGDMIIDTDELKVPHPLMHERMFVLAPLKEIAPDAVHPVLGKSVDEMLEALKVWKRRDT